MRISRLQYRFALKKYYWGNLQTESLNNGLNRVVLIHHGVIMGVLSGIMVS